LFNYSPLIKDTPQQQTINDSNYNRERPQKDFLTINNIKSNTNSNYNTINAQHDDNLSRFSKDVPAMSTQQQPNNQQAYGNTSYYDEGGKKITPSYQSKYATPADSNFQFQMGNFMTTTEGNMNTTTDNNKSYGRNHSSSNLRINNNNASNNNLYMQTDNSVLRDVSRNYSASRNYSDMGTTPLHSGSDMKHLEKLKSKIKDLENKIVHFNKGNLSLTSR
jgi:hypothetical protein